MLTEIDQEIISIVKETFRKKSKKELIDPDDLMREYCIKSTFLISSLVVVLSIFLDSNKELEMIGATLVSVFFMLLFFQINIKSKNPSLIMYGLTFISVLIPIWV